MRQDEPPRNLEQVLDLLGTGTADREEVTLRTMLHTVGERSFAPILLVPGVIMFSPLSGIPGMATLSSMLVLLIAAQLLMRRRHFWVPDWLERRSLSRRRLDTMLRTARPVARGVDRVIKPRLSGLTRDAGTYVAAVICLFVAISVPPLEIVPFLPTTAGGVLVVLALALIAHDGLLALAAVLLMVGAYGSLVWILL